MPLYDVLLDLCELNALLFAQLPGVFQRKTRVIEPVQPVRRIGVMPVVIKQIVQQSAPRNDLTVHFQPAADTVGYVRNAVNMLYDRNVAVLDIFSHRIELVGVAVIFDAVEIIAVVFFVEII